MLGSFLPLRYQTAWFILEAVIVIYMRCNDTTYHSPALVAAAYKGHLSICKLLISKGAEVNTKYKSNGTADTSLQTDDIKEFTGIKKVDKN